jgi:hypothetical protein
MKYTVLVIHGLYRGGLASISQHSCPNKQEAIRLCDHWKAMGYSVTMGQWSNPEA